MSLGKKKIIKISIFHYKYTPTSSPQSYANPGESEENINIVLQNG